MRRLHPRSPYQKLGGYVHLPRLIDKARLHRKGLLDGYNDKTVGFDKHLLACLKIDGDACEAIEEWNEAMTSRHPDTAAKKARFLHFLKEAGGDGRKDIRTYFDLIEFDEGRLK